MKKNNLVLICLALSINFCGCNSPESKNEPKEKTRTGVTKQTVPFLHEGVFKNVNANGITCNDIHIIFDTSGVECDNKTSTTSKANGKSPHDTLNIDFTPATAVPPNKDVKLKFKFNVDFKIVSWWWTKDKVMTGGQAFGNPQGWK